ncbi:hypothetical protein [Phoenicibacter congonensis]|uniref:hypothetical protein n=1 Tax=Phoenicibacter congonensis TaxID=1944646 RepID=UPI0011C78B15|nr:hypothetical protein [Phoenicibacter congonensis]
MINQTHTAVLSGKTVHYEVSLSEYRTKHEFRIPVVGKNGRTKKVLAVYQIDKGSMIQGMIANFPESKRKWR